MKYSREVLTLGQQSLHVMRDASYSDERKEQIIQLNTVIMFKLLLRLLSGTALAFLLPLSGLWIFDQAGWINLDVIFDWLLRWNVIVTVSIFGMVIYWAGSRWQTNAS